MQLCKTLFLDLDNTLYDYDKTHKEALEDTFAYCNKNCGADLEQYYNKSRSKVHSLLKGTASAHNRLLYFQNVCRETGMKEFVAIKLHDHYWKKYYSIMPNYISPGIRNFLRLMKDNGCCIIMVTNFLATYQFQKLRALLLLPFIDHVVSSEEVGIEKPNPLILLHALHLSKNKAEECLYIGDSYEQDIKCASEVGIPTLWFTNEIESSISKGTFSCFEKLTLLLKECLASIDEYVYLSRLFGQRYDLVQAGGGNLSIKNDDLIIIKASGTNMGEVEKGKNGYVVLKMPGCEKLFMAQEKPSMETFFHIILPHKYVIHLHPILVNACSNFDFVPNSITIKYTSPGKKLAAKIKQAIANYNSSIEDLEWIFMKNHGCIACSNDLNGLISSIRNTFFMLQTMFNIDIYKYEVGTKISMWMEKKFSKKTVFYCSEDFILQSWEWKKKKTQALTPDFAIYVGFRVCFCDYEDINSITLSIKSYHVMYELVPNVIKTPNHIYIFSSSIEKCRNIEQVLKSQVEILTLTNHNVFLSLKEVRNLHAMPSEIYRRTL